MLLQPQLRLLLFREENAAIAAVDATVEGKAADAAGGIKGYPTIRYYKAGKDSEDYKGARKAQDFHDFLVDKILGSKKVAREHRVKNEL